MTEAAILIILGLFWTQAYGQDATLPGSAGPIYTTTSYYPTVVTDYPPVTKPNVTYPPPPPVSTSPPSPTPVDTTYPISSTVTVTFPVSTAPTTTTTTTTTTTPTTTTKPTTTTRRPPLCYKPWTRCRKHTDCCSGHCNETPLGCTVCMPPHP